MPRLTPIQRKLLEMAAQTASTTPERVLEELASAASAPRTRAMSWRDSIQGTLADVWSDLPLEAQLIAFDFGASINDAAQDMP